MPEALPQQNNLDDAFFKAGTSFKRAIPGQSLTSDPETPMPFERPPKLTNRGEALEYYFELLTEEEMYLSDIDAVESGIPLMDVVKPLLIQGFQEGLFNPDMVMLLAEPLTYMIAALAERADIDFTIMGDEDEYNDDVEDTEKVPAPLMNKIKSMPLPTNTQSLLGER